MILVLVVQEKSIKSVTENRNLVIKNPRHFMKRKGERGGEVGGGIKNVVFIIVVSEADTECPNFPLYPRIFSIA